MDIPTQAYDRICQFCGQTVAERMLLSSHELYCAKTKLAAQADLLKQALEVVGKIQRDINNDNLSYEARVGGVRIQIESSVFADLLAIIAARKVSGGSAKATPSQDE